GSSWVIVVTLKKRVGAFAPTCFFNVTGRRRDSLPARRSPRRAAQGMLPLRPLVAASPYGASLSTIHACDQKLIGPTSPAGHVVPKDARPKLSVTAGTSSCG